MFKLPVLSSERKTSLLFALVTLTSVPFVYSVQQSVIAAPEKTANFPDIQNHWAQPFITRLAERNIVTGYPDGTYRPNQSVDRDEFAAIIRQAFNQKKERTIPSGSVYKDVPANYWAAQPIEEAYEMGFMHGYPGEYFRPKQPVSRVEALVSLSQNLNLTTAQTARKKTARRQFFLPIAMTNLMQPLMTAKATNKTVSPLQNAPASAVVSKYYTDANKIPQYAVDDVAAATQAGIVVNYPNTKVLNPNQPATRGTIAAFIYQALVNQGRLQPLPNNVKASNYIVAPSQAISTNAQTQTQK